MRPLRWASSCSPHAAPSTATDTPPSMVPRDHHWPKREIWSSKVAICLKRQEFCNVRGPCDQVCEHCAGQGSHLVGSDPFMTIDASAAYLLTSERRGGAEMSHSNPVTTVPSHRKPERAAVARAVEPSHGLLHGHGNKG